MSNNEHPDGRGEPHRPVRCTFGPVRERDLVWPPPDEDLDAMTVIRLDGKAVPRPAFKPTFGDCRAPGVAPRVRPLVVPMDPRAAASTGLLAGTTHATTPETESTPEPALEPETGSATEPEQASPATTVEVPPLVFVPRRVAASETDPEITGASRSAWLAAIFAAACAIVAVAEYRLIFSLPAEASMAAVEPPPMPPELSTAELAPIAVRVRTPVAKSSSATPSFPKPVAKAPVPAPRIVATEPVRPSAVALQPGRASARPPAPPPPSALAPAKPVAVPSPQPRPDSPPRALTARASASPSASPASGRPPAVVSASAAIRPPAASATPAARPAPSTPAAASTTPRASSTASAVATAPVPMPDRDAPVVRPVPTVVALPANADEADIRSTLTRFRTAYSQLDARAARDVWPSVDARALERAFQSLKSQELRFDRCSLTVTGARAQAACTGRATYVPRIGDQSPRFTSREWTFELRKADERWTIASARTL